MSDISTIVILALLAEAIIQNLLWVVEGRMIKERIIALVVSITLAVLTAADVLQALGMPMIFPYVGSVFTGILISRGANVLHDLWKKIQPLTTENAAHVIEIPAPEATPVSPEVPPYDDPN